MEVLAPPPKNRAPPPVLTVGATVPQSRQIQEAADTVESKNDSGVDYEGSSIIDLSEIKREVKRISNKRALVIASRLSGKNQDDELRNSEKTLSRAEAELARVRSMKLKNPTEKVSSILIDNGWMTTMDVLRQKLENLRTVSKDEVSLLLFA